jgi:hypothetical protein
MSSKVLLGVVGLMVSLTAFPVMTSWADDATPGPAVPTAGVAAAKASVAASSPAVRPAASASTAPPVVASASASSAAASPTAAAPSPTPTTPTASPTPTPTVSASPTPSSSASPSPTATSSPTPTASPTPPAGTPGLRVSQRLVLSSDRDHDGRADSGDGVRVVAVVTNSGQVTLRSVRVTDDLVTRLGGSVRCGTTVLPRGASTTCTSGSVQVTRTQAKAGVLTNQITANARTAAGKLVRSSTSTARLQVQKPGRKHGHPKGHHKHRHHKHAERRHHQRHAHQHRLHQRVVTPTAKLGLTQFVLSVSDKNKNGQLEAGDSIRFGFKITNTGALSVQGLHIVGRRLAHFKVPVTCAATELAPGATTGCTSGGLPITRYQAKKRLGSNFAYAAGTTAGGTAVRSNSTVIVLGRSTARLTHLPNTGSSLSRPELGATGALLVGGVILLVVGRRRRWSAPRRQAPTS